MAKYATLKAAVEAAIKTNGQQQITGQVLQTQLVNMITSLGKYFQSFGGLATPAGSFSAGDESVTFLAVEAGTYTNFGGAVLDGKTLHILAYDGDWADVDTHIPSGAAFEAALALAIKGSQSGIAEGIADVISAGTAQEFLQRQSGGDGVNCLKRIKGRTRAWNQLLNKGDLNLTQTYNQVTTVGNREDGTITFSGTANGSENFALSATSSDKMIRGHKYCLCGATSTTPPLRMSDQITSFDTGSGMVWTCQADNVGVQLACKIVSGVTYSGKIKVKIVDLTLLYGSEISGMTDEQILAKFQSEYPELYYPYNAGELRNNDAEGLETVGFNQWDEVTELGIIDSQTGLNSDSTTQIRAKNYFKVFGSTNYYLKLTGGGIWAFFYDSNFSPIGDAVAGSTQQSNLMSRIDDGAVFTTPQNAYYMRFFCFGSYGTTYKNDICINLSWSGYRNGEYEPYWQRFLALRLSELTGIPEGGTEADRVTMFPNGLRGLGTSYDEIAGGKATKRRGVRAYESGDESDASVITDGTNTDYALTTPIVYTDLQYADGTPFTMPATILVDDYGTERIQAPEGATTPSAPFCCDSNYSIGVANLVKRLAALENAE